MRPNALVAIGLFLASCGGAWGDEFQTITSPSFAAIEPRLVYGTVTYDFSFVGNNNAVRSQSASKFMQDLIQSKFSSKKGNYVVTLDVFIDNKKITSEPILSANWETTHFLWITTAEKTNLVINRAGVLAENLVVDSSTNKIGISVNVKFSDSTSVDLSILKELADLSKTSSLSSFVPGIGTVAAAYAPFASILTQLLSHYTDTSIVDSTIGAFTLLDEGFANQLRYNADRFILNIYFKTENSQLPTNFSPVSGFKITNFSLPLTEVKSGVGAARAPVLEIIAGQDNDVGSFVKSITTGKLFGGGASPAEVEIKTSCESLKRTIDTFVNTRDTALLYWAFLRSYKSELSKYKDWRDCGSGDLTDDLGQLGLVLGADWTQ